MPSIRKKSELSSRLGVIMLLGVIAASCSQQPASSTTTASPSPAVSPAATVPGTGAPPGGAAAGPGGAAVPQGGAAAGGSQPTGSAPSAGGGTASSVPAPPPPPKATPAPPRTFTLAAGRTISIYTEHSLTTKSTKTGDVFLASLANAITDGDWVIAKKGAQVDGVVSDSDSGGKVKGVASLSIKLKSLQLADGSKISISSNTLAREAKSTKKKDAAKIGIGAGVGAAIGAIAGGGKGAAIGAGVGGGGGTAVVLATKGDPAVIPAESHLSFQLTSAVKVTKR
jgi:hypothetical protein